MKKKRLGSKHGKTPGGFFYLVIGNMGLEDTSQTLKIALKVKL